MEFKKSGFNEEDSATLAGVAAMYQNVADDAIGAGESANFIISQMKAFGLEAEDATHIIDALNEVSNTQAVSSADLANNLGKASAAMALGNNTYEQALSMMTAITEINRSGAKSARALVSVQSRLTQVLDEQSSTGKALVEIYNGLGIALKDQNGQLRPTFEIFKDLAAVWPDLTTNQKDYIALTQAGANQTANFVALMDNFDAALKAEATAMKSSGSAARENAAYMESLEAQTTQLKATFQDFANNVIDKELVSSILTLANDVLGALNTETGKTITQWGLLTGVLTGGIVIYGQIAGKLLSAGSAVITLGKALSAGTATATMFTSAALPIAAAIGAIAVAGWKVYEWYKETHQPLSEYTSQIESNNEQLEKNQERLEEINKMSWVDRTPDILAEKEALEKENAELRENIALNEQRSLDQAKRLANQEVTVVTGSRYKSSLLGMDWASQEEAIKDINDIYGEGTWIAGVYIKTLKEVNTTITAQGDALNNYLINELEKYDDILQSNNSLTEEEQIARNNIIQAAKSQVETYQFLDEKVGGLTESQKNLISAYNESVQVEAEAKDWTEKYGDALVITDEQAQQLIKTFPILKDHLKQTNEGWVVLETTVGEAAGALISADGRIKKSSKDRVASTLADIKAEVEAYKELYTITLYQPYSNTDPDYEEKKRKIGEAKKGYEASAAALVRLQQAVARTKTEGYYDDVSDIPTGTSTTKTKKDKDKDLALKEFKNLQKDLEHQKELGLIKEEEYYDKLEQLIKDYKAKATAHMKEYGTDVDTINRNMYQYEEEIYKGRAKLAEDLAEQQKKAAEEAAKAQKEALEKRKEEFETAVNYVIKQIDKEIDKLQDLRNQTEQYYDDKIDALNDANDELERQIQYEELLNNLAQAKNKQLYVFQNGQFQYVQDVEAIASAQAELDAYKRDEELRKEVENLEALKEQALASIDEQIKGWEQYKEEWEGVTTQYQEQQDKLLAEQVLGIEMEQSNWETRLTNLQSFVAQYNAILSQLNSGTTISSTSNATGGGGANIASGSGGWSGIPHDTDNDFDRDEVIKNDTSIGKGRDYLAEAIAAADKGDIDKAYALLDERDKKLDAQGRNSAGGVNKEESRDIINVHLDGYTTSKHANGTISAPGGLSLVGEKGPELRVLNSGDGIIPADATRNLWDWATYNPKDLMGSMGSDNIFHIGNIALPNVTDAKSFVNGLKQLAYQRAYKRA